MNHTTDNEITSTGLCAEQFERRVRERLLLLTHLTLNLEDPDAVITDDEDLDSLAAMEYEMKARGYRQALQWVLRELLGVSFI